MPVFEAYGMTVFVNAKLWGNGSGEDPELEAPGTFWGNSGDGEAG